MSLGQGWCIPYPISLSQGRFSGEPGVLAVAKIWAACSAAIRKMIVIIAIIWVAAVLTRSGYPLPAAITGGGLVCVAVVGIARQIVDRPASGQA